MGELLGHGLKYTVRSCKIKGEFRTRSQKLSGRLNESDYSTKKFRLPGGWADRNNAIIFGPVCKKDSTFIYNTQDIFVPKTLALPFAGHIGIKYQVFP